MVEGGRGEGVIEGVRDGGMGVGVVIGAVGLLLGGKDSAHRLREPSLALHRRPTPFPHLRADRQTHVTTISPELCETTHKPQLNVRLKKKLKPNF